MNTQTPALVIDQLSKRFDNTVALAGLSLTLPRGQIYGLLGGNGAGKTTTIALILGLIQPTAGQITILGHPMPQQRAKVLSRFNFSSPYIDVPYRLTVWENLRVYAELYGVDKPLATIDRLINELRLNDYRDKAVGFLSAGQKTRMSLAKAMLNNPELLLLDEPTASLDPATAAWIRQYLLAYRARTGAAILLSSHNMGEVEQLCDRALLLRQGVLIANATPRALIDQYGVTTLEEAFLATAQDPELAV